MILSRREALFGAIAAAVGAAPAAKALQALVAPQKRHIKATFEVSNDDWRKLLDSSESIEALLIADMARQIAEEEDRRFLKALFAAKDTPTLMASTR